MTDCPFEKYLAIKRAQLKTQQDGIEHFGEMISALEAEVEQAKQDIAGFHIDRGECIQTADRIKAEIEFVESLRRN